MTDEACSPVSVAIPNFGRDTVLVDTVGALLGLKRPPAQIVLADQTPQHDPDTEWQLNLWRDGVRIEWLHLMVPSIPHAMNEGLIAASNDIVIFCDDDVVRGVGLIESHLTAHSDFPGGIVAGRILQPWHHGEADPSGHQPFGFNSLESRAGDEFMGGNFSLFRDDALGIGGFDENFPRG